MSKEKLIEATADLRTAEGIRGFFMGAVSDGDIPESARDVAKIVLALGSAPGSPLAVDEDDVLKMMNHVEGMRTDVEVMSTLLYLLDNGMAQASWPDGATEPLWGLNANGMDMVENNPDLLRKAGAR